MRLLHGIETARARQAHRLREAVFRAAAFSEAAGHHARDFGFLRKPGEDHAHAEPLRFRGNELVLFHILDPHGNGAEVGRAVLLVDMETDDTIEASPEYARTSIATKFSAHIEESARAKREARASTIFCCGTDRPLDDGLREYFTVRQRRM